MDVERALSGGAGLAGVHSLLHGPGQSELTRTVESMLRRGRRVRSLRLRRAHFKPGRKLAAYYELVVDADLTATPLAVTWYASGAGADSRIAAAEGEIQQRGLAPQFERLWCEEMSGLMRLTVAPLDPVFPDLVCLADPSHLPALLLRELPFLANGDAASVAFIRYRPGQRHVLAYRAGRGAGAFAKLYRPGESAPVARAVTAFAGILDPADGAGVRAVAPSAVLEEVDAVLYDRIPGTPLSRRLRTGQAIQPDLLVSVGRWLCSMHSMSDAKSDAFPQRDFIGEAKRAVRACAAMNGLRPDLGSRATSMLGTAGELFGATEQEPPVVVHGDMKADHLLCSAREVRVLDTDSCAIADPALDLGKLLADLQWWTWLSGHTQQLHVVEAALLAGYSPSASRLVRARLYAALFLVKMAGRRVSVARRDWARSTAEVLDLGARVLGAQTGVSAR